MLIISIEKSTSNNVDGPRTLVRVSPKGGMYEVWASKNGDPARQHRRFLIPRQVDGEKGIYRILARVFKEITL